MLPRYMAKYTLQPLLDQDSVLVLPPQEFLSLLLHVPVAGWVAACQAHPGARPWFRNMDTVTVAG